MTISIRDCCAYEKAKNTDEIEIHCNTEETHTQKKTTH